jgi:hypothetical protein
MVARTPRYTPAAPGTRSKPQIPATGKLTENVYVFSPDDPPDFTGTLTKS